eukprot:4245418-Pyramimonas_sp.AAC.1
MPRGPPSKGAAAQSLKAFIPTEAQTKNAVRSWTPCTGRLSHRVDGEAHSPWTSHRVRAFWRVSSIG